MNRNALSSIGWLLFVCSVFALLVPSLFGLRHDPIGPGRPAPAFLAKHWQVFYGDNPGPDARWLSFDEREQRKLEGYKGGVTIRRTLPALKWADPYLFLSGMNRFEAKLDGKTIYRFRLDGGPAWNHLLMKQHPIPLNSADAGKELLIHMKWDGMPFGWSYWIMGANPDQIVLAELRGDLKLYGSAVLYIAVGVVAFILAVRRRLRKLFLWFGLLAWSAGFGVLLLAQSLQWLANVGALYYWRDMMLPLAVLAFTGFYGEALGEGGRKAFRIAKTSLLAFTALAFAAAFRSQVLYWSLLVDWLPFLTLSVLVVITVCLLSGPGRKLQSDVRRWLLRGYTLLIFTGLCHMLGNFSPQLIVRAANVSPYLLTVIGNLLTNGLLLFMICMAMVLVSLIRNVYREAERNAGELRQKNEELEQFHKQLERLVDVRTTELAETNRALTDTMREKAETMAEMSVLEERSRIAHEMHDVVGHTLTAAIMQVEAARKLAAREGALPLDKLETVGGLVRKGLDDVRKTVRLLKSDEAQLALEPALRNLIRETAATMEVDIQAEIGLPIELRFGRLAEKVLYHALQEGLTNGIRHGRCRRFRFVLRPEDEMLVFSLWNDGEPLRDAAPGFGLTAMKERVELLGGTLFIGTASGLAGEEFGCELRLTLPLERTAAV